MPKYKRLSDDDRKRIINLYKDGNRPSKIARLLELKRNTIDSIIKIFNQTGRFQCLKKGGKKQCKLTAEQKNEIIQWVNDNCKLSLKQISLKCFEKFNVKISQTTINNYLRGFHYTINKTITEFSERRNDTDTVLARQNYAMNFLRWQTYFTENKIIFIDEVCYKLSIRMGKRNGSSKSKSSNATTSIRSRNISICVAFMRSGILYLDSKIGPYNSDSFHDFLNNLLKILGDDANNHLFIIGNIRFRDGNNIKESLFTGKRITCEYLPSYSPFLNPIDNMFSNLKNLIKRTTTEPNNEKELMDLIKNGSKLITQSDCEQCYSIMLSYIERCMNNQVIID